MEDSKMAYKAYERAVEEKADRTKLLKRKKLSGVQVGEAMIAETIENYRQMQAGKQPRGIFTPEERQKLVDRITTEKDYHDYHDYRAIENLIQKYLPLLQGGVQGFYNGYNTIYTLFNNATHSEKAKVYLEAIPAVMTEKQYREEKERLQAGYLEKEISYQALIGEALHYHTGREGSPIRKAVDNQEGKPIENPRIIQAWGGTLAYDKGQKEREEDKNPLNLINAIEQAGPPPAISTIFLQVDNTGTPDKKNILYFIIADPHRWGTLYGDNFHEFIEDYPEVYQALQEEIASTLGEIAEQGTTWGQLYDKNLYECGEMLDSDSFLFKRKVSILRDPQAEDLDNKGYYKHPYAGKDNINDYIFGGFKTVYDNQDNRGLAENARDQTIRYYRMILSINTLFTLLGERLNLPDMEIFKEDIEILEGLIASLNNVIFLQFKNIPYIEDKEEREWKTNLVKEIFPPIDLSIYQTTPQALKESRKLLKDIAQIRVYDSLILSTLRGEA